MKFPIKKSASFQWTRVHFLLNSRHQQDCTLKAGRCTLPSTLVRDIRLDSGHVVCKNFLTNHGLVVSNNLSRFQKDRAIVKALKKVMMGFKQNQPTNHARPHLLGAFAAACPQISTDCQALIIALAQRNLMLEVKAVVESDCLLLGIGFLACLEKHSQLVSVFHCPCQVGHFPLPETSMRSSRTRCQGQFLLLIRWRAKGARGSTLHNF
jgi:hypothetical protein